MVRPLGEWLAGQHTDLRGHSGVNLERVLQSRSTAPAAPCQNTQQCQKHWGGPRAPPGPTLLHLGGSSDRFMLMTRVIERQPRLAFRQGSGQAYAACRKGMDLHTLTSTIKQGIGRCGQK